MCLASGKLNAFYLSVVFPVHLRNLLHLYGVTEIEDLVLFDDAAIKRIEEGIRNGSLTSAYIDLSKKQEHKRYFGVVVHNPQQFKFRLLDLEKLRKISERADAHLNGKREGTEPNQTRICFERNNFKESSQSRDSAIASEGSNWYVIF